MQTATRWRFYCWTWLVPPILLAIVCGLTATIYLAGTRLDGLSWDDSEYVTQVLTSYDILAERGFARWPLHIAREQNGAKPILYVNSVISSLALVGRTHLVRALALTAFMTATVFAFVVFFIVRPAAGDGVALLAMLAVSGTPAVMQWSSMVFPDLQFATLILLTIGLLATTRSQWGLWRTIALGVLLGLALLAKATAPSFLLLPILWWLVRGHPQDGGIIRRLGILITAGIVALLVASIWYGTHWRDAVGYVKSSYGFKVDDQGSLPHRAWSWTTFLLWSGLGWPLVLAIAIGLVAWTRRNSGSEGAVSRPALPRGYALYFILGALAPIPVAISSSTPPNTRHLLPTLVLVAVPAVVMLGRALIQSKNLRAGLAVVWVLMLGQFVAGRASQTNRFAGRASASGFMGLLTSSLPQGAIRHVVSRPASDDILSVAAAQADRLPADWFLAGNDAGVNTYRLQMLAAYRRLPQEFLYAVYFAWPDEQCQEMLARMLTRPSVLVLYSGWKGDGDMFYTPRDREMIKRFIDDPAHGFKLLPELVVRKENYSLDFYWNGGASNTAVGTELAANFNDQILLKSAAWRDGVLRVRVRALAPIRIDYKLLLHGVVKGPEPVEVWDQYISPSLRRWPVGDERTLFFFVPANRQIEQYEVHMGFFNDHDLLHPTLPLRSGQSFLSIPGGMLSREAAERK